MLKQAELMQLSGYDAGFRDDDEAVGRLLGEVSFAVRDANELRQIADFFTNAADVFETLGRQFSHEHFRDWCDDWSEGEPDLVVYRID